MKLLSTSASLAIAFTLMTTVVGSITAIEASANPGVKLPAPVKIIAQGESTPLAAQLQGKPVIVDIYASWCPACKNIAPTLSQLKQKYGAKANFIVFDVSDSKKTKASMKKAAELGLTSFLSTNKSQTGAVAIIDPTTGKVTKQLRNNADIAEYTGVIDRSIAQMAAGDGMKKPDAMSPGDAMKKP